MTVRQRRFAAGLFPCLHLNALVRNNLLARFGPGLLIRRFLTASNDARTRAQKPEQRRRPKTIPALLADQL